MGRIIAGIVLIIIGLSAFFGENFFKIAFSVILIAIGVRILTGRRRGIALSGEKRTSGEDYLNEAIIFSPIEKTITSENFQGGKVVVVFGGGELDLREVKTAGENIEMEVTAIFGGLKIMIPKNWKVNSKGTAIFGGYDNHTSGAGNITLNLKGAAIFGGVEITN
ncbi:MAG: LiaF domain-containing protein [Patescibacteria group bacterium]|jgi:predicted membrane protein